MEIAAMSNSVQSCGGVSQSSFVMISKEDDEDKKTVIIAMSQNMDGIASQHYRDSLGRPAIGTYNEGGAMNGSMQTLGSSVNISV